MPQTAFVELPGGQTAWVELPDGPATSAVAQGAAQVGQLAQAAPGTTPVATPTPGPASPPPPAATPSPAAPQLPLGMGVMMGQVPEAVKRLALGATDLVTFPLEAGLTAGRYANEAMGLPVMPGAFGEIRQGISQAMGLQEPESKAGRFIATTLENLGGGAVNLGKRAVAKAAPALAKLGLGQLAKLEAASAVFSAAGEEGLAALVNKDSSFAPYARLVGALAGTLAFAAGRPVGRWAAARMGNPELDMGGAVVNRVPEQKLAQHLMEVSDFSPEALAKQEAQLQRVAQLQQELAPIGYQPSLQAAGGDPGFAGVVRQQSQVSGEFHGQAQRNVEANFRRIYQAVQEENPFQEADVDDVVRMLEREGQEQADSLFRIEQEAGAEGLALKRAVEDGPNAVDLGDTFQEGLGALEKDFRHTSEAVFNSIGVNQPTFKAPIPQWSPRANLKPALQEVLKQEEAASYTTKGALQDITRTSGTSMVDLTDPLRPLRAIMNLSEPQLAEAGRKRGQLVGGPSLGDLKDALHYVRQGLRRTTDRDARRKYAAAEAALREETDWLARGGLSEKEALRYQKALERAPKNPDGSPVKLPAGVKAPTVPAEVALGAQELKRANDWFGVKVRPMRDDTMNRILAPSAQGRRKMKAEDVAEHLIGNSKGIRNYRELKEAFTEVEPTGEFYPDGAPVTQRVPHPVFEQLDQAVEASLRRKFYMENVDPATGQLNGGKALQWLGENKELLADFPGMAESFKALARKREIFREIQVPVIERARGEWEASLAGKLTKARNAPEAMEELEKLSPAQRATEFRDMAAKAAKHSDPRASVGVQKLALELVRRDAGIAGADFWDNPTLGGQAFVEAVRSNRAALLAAGYTPARLKYLENLATAADIELKAAEGLGTPKGDLEAHSASQKVGRAAIRGAAWVRGNPRKVLSILMAAGGEAAALTVGQLSSAEMRAILLRSTYDPEMYKALMNLARKSADPPAALRSLRERLVQMGGRASQSSLAASQAQPPTGVPWEEEEE